MLFKFVFAVLILAFLGLLVYSSIKNKRNPKTCCTPIPADQDARMRDPE